MKKNTEEITFKDILGIFIPKAWIILLVAVLFASLFAVYSTVLVDDTYTTYSIMNIRKDTEALQPGDMNLAEDIIDVVSYRIQSSDFLNNVLVQVNNNYGYQGLTLSQIKSSIRYTPLGNGVLKISVTTENPQLSLAIAQALENEVPNEFYSFLPNALKVEPYSMSYLPKSPDSKGVLTNTLIGFLGVAVVSSIVIWVYSVFDVVIKNKKKIEDNFDVSVIGVIPAEKINAVKTEAR